VNNTEIDVLEEDGIEYAFAHKQCLSDCGSFACEIRNHLRDAWISSMVKGKVIPCTGTEALYRPYGP